MDSFAQELIDETIHRIPRGDMPTSSLVARRWRHTSQRRHFEFVRFSRDDLIFWEANIPRDPDGIPSYVRHVRFQHNSHRSGPAIFVRVLRTFRSIVSLMMVNIGGLRPEGLVSPVLFSEFGKNITRLTLASMLYIPFTGAMALIFSFPNLKELVINNIHSPAPDEPPMTLPDASQKGSLELLILQMTPKEVSANLAQNRFTSRTVRLNPCDESAELFAIHSSETVVALTLAGMQLLRVFGERDEC